MNLMMCASSTKRELTSDSREIPRNDERIVNRVLYSICETCNAKMLPKMDCEPTQIHWHGQIDDHGKKGTKTFPPNPPGYHPQAQDEIERSAQEMKTQLRAHCPNYRSISRRRRRLTAHYREHLKNWRIDPRIRPTCFRKVQTEEQTPQSRALGREVQRANVNNMRLTPRRRASDQGQNKTTQTTVWSLKTSAAWPRLQTHRNRKTPSRRIPGENVRLRDKTLTQSLHRKTSQRLRFSVGRSGMRDKTMGTDNTIFRCRTRLEEMIRTGDGVDKILNRDETAATGSILHPEGDAILRSIALKTGSQQVCVHAREWALPLLEKKERSLFAR